MSVVRKRVRSPFTLLAGVAAVGWAVAILALIGRPSASPTPIRTPMTSQVTYVSAPRRLSSAGEPLALHSLRYRASGGPVTVRWYDSDVESTHPRQVALISLAVDGRRVASTAKTALTGTLEDGQGDLVWHGQLSRGMHVIQVIAADAESWGFPYVDAGRQGVDELIVAPEGIVAR